MKTYVKVGLVVAVAMALVSVPGRIAIAGDEEYSFKLHNTTEQRITKLMASEDKKEWGSFDIGKGVPAGEIVTLKWDKKTNDSGCNWYVKAVFADGEESESKKFDFCEEDLELEF